jgi:hypothetical protein
LDCSPALMMIRRVLVLHMGTVTEDHTQVQVFQHAVRLLSRPLRSSADSGRTKFVLLAAVAVGKWKAFCAFQAQRLFHGPAQAADSDGC